MITAITDIIFTTFARTIIFYNARTIEMARTANATTELIEAAPLSEPSSGFSSTGSDEELKKSGGRTLPELDGSTTGSELDGSAIGILVAAAVELEASGAAVELDGITTGILELDGVATPVDDDGIAAGDDEEDDTAGIAGDDDDDRTVPVDDDGITAGDDDEEETAGIAGDDDDDRTAPVDDEATAPVDDEAAAAPVDEVGGITTPPAGVKRNCLPLKLSAQSCENSTSFHRAIQSFTPVF